MKYPSSSPRWVRTLRSARKLPADLVAVSLVVVLADVVVLVPGIRATPLRPAVGLPVLLLAPGYVLTAVLFPARGGRDTGGRARGVDWPERLALSLGGSVVLLPLLGVGLVATGLGLGAPAVMAGLDAVVVAGVLLGAVRRWQLPERDRLRVPTGRVAAALHDAFEGRSVRTALNVVLAASVLVAVGALGFALAVPNPGESYTGFSLLTENESGDLVAEGYPTEFVAGQPQALTVGVTNGERERTRYTVVVEVHRVEDVGGSLSVRDQREAARLRTTLDPGEQWHRRVAVAPRMVGDDVRLEYFLYRGSAPADADAESADEHLHLWIEVSEPES